MRKTLFLFTVFHMKILIVDDSESIRERLDLMVRRTEENAVVIQARNVYEGIEKALEFKPDITILDIKMPGGSGIDVLRELKNRGLETVVIMLTNYPYPQYREKCMKEGADYFFDKSTEFELVIEVMKEVML